MPNSQNLKGIYLDEVRAESKQTGKVLTESEVEAVALKRLRKDDVLAREIESKPKRTIDPKPVDLTKGGTVKKRKRNLDILTDKPFHKMDKRAVAAWARIERIIAPADECSRIVMDSTKDIREKCQFSETPKLATEFWIAYLNYKMFRYSKKYMNPFYGKNDVDCARILQRLVEDICDRSTGKMGPWWVR